MSLTQFGKIVEVLIDGQVDFILIGGVAGRALGLFRNTEDIDVVYERSSKNIKRLIAALKPYAPYPRGAPPGLPFHFDERQIQNGLNFTFETTLGWLDILGEAAGGGNYHALLPNSTIIPLFGRDVRCVNLETLIRLKQAAGRPKDFEALAELHSLRIRKDRVDQ